MSGARRRARIPAEYADSANDCPERAVGPARGEIPQDSSCLTGAGDAHTRTRTQVVPGLLYDKRSDVNWGLIA